jgi:phenylalanyl-tRNA synthetase beta chain
MKIVMSWLRDMVEGLPSTDAVAAELIRIGFEVEAVERTGEDTSGVVAGEVTAIEVVTTKKKDVRWVRVRVADGAEPRGVICGAFNFDVGDRVAVALPGATLPGGFQITARKTYGHLSDGMICSERELGIGDNHDGILVLPPGTPPGTDLRELLALRDEVLDIAVTPDRGYALSVRGIAREAAVAFGLPFVDPADGPAHAAAVAAAGPGYPVVISDTAGCDRYVARVVTGVDVAARTPFAARRRLALAGMRPISVPVDVTNLVMLGLGQPLHAFDRAKVSGPIDVRRARPGERLVTLDGVDRALDPDDLVIADDRGPIALAGVMGGASTEISATTTDIIVESAHFDPVTIARTARRHKLGSEASRRFERTVDPALGPAAAEAAVRMLTELAGATAEPGGTDVDHRVPAPEIRLGVGEAERLGGRPYPPEVVAARLADVGCASRPDQAGVLLVTPPSWRPDLTRPADLVEEIVRLEGYDTIPVTLPRLPAGRGLTAAQRLRRGVGRALAYDGYVEALTVPFVGDDAADRLGLPAGDARRSCVRIANPIAADAGRLRSTLLPGLIAAAVRAAGRGSHDLALFELGSVFIAGPAAGPVPSPGVAGRPSDTELAALDAVLPSQPRHVAALLTGLREPAGWWGPGRPADWGDAVSAARTVAGACGVELSVAAGEMAPWHPGRCAALRVDGVPVGYAGELHPRVVAAFDLPERTCAMELDLDAVVAAGVARPPVAAAAVSAYPPADRDVALVVADGIGVAEVSGALADGAGPLLESLRLFDVYAGVQVGEGRRSLAFGLRLRAPDRTLTAEEANAARDAAVAEAARRTGAALRA